MTDCKRKNMNIKELSLLLIKISGAIIIIVSIRDVAYLVAPYLPYPKEYVMSLVLIAVLLVVQFTIGATLFIKAERVTNIFWKKDAQEKRVESGGEVDLLQLEQIILSIIGFFIIFRASSDILYHIINFAQAFYSWPVEAENPPIKFIYSSTFLTTIAELIFGVLLLLNTRSLSGFLNKLRKEN